MRGKQRPTYFVVRDGQILWFIPLSTKVEKYQMIIEQKIKKYGNCKTIMIEKLIDRDSVILIQNAFPTLEKYIDHIHTIDGIPIKVREEVEKKIVANLNYMFSMKKKGINLFFSDVDKIKEKMLDELLVKN